MTERILALNPTTEGTGTHDPSAAIFVDGELRFGAEEERFNRQKHAMSTFPKRAVQAGLDYCELDLSDVDSVALSWKPKNKAKYDMRLDTEQSNLKQKLFYMLEDAKNYSRSTQAVRSKLSELGTTVPPIRTYNHHRCHAASAFYPSEFDEALVVSVDGRGEKDSTVIWKGDDQGLERLETYQYPNSLGAFYGSITVYLGYRLHNGEGKIMGLAPYGSHNQEIEDALLEVVTPGVDYDVSALNYHTGGAIATLESIFDRPKKARGGEFSEWEKDLAYTAQRFVETSMAEIVETYCREHDLSAVALAGGVALNCKMNKRIMELDAVDEVFVQPVSNDAGSAIGAGLLESDASTFGDMDTVYWGPDYETSHIKERLEEYKIAYSEPSNVARTAAERIAAGELVGWFQGRMEMGPRALGNRSIVADPRSVASRDRVNEFVKHREGWRPFAPSMLEGAADEYLVDAQRAPYMIKTFDVEPEKKAEIPAVLHAADDTTRPQTVRADQNPRYHELISEFEAITGVPVVLNTSFNDNGEPIVNTPTEAIKDFFGMGLDLLVLEDIVVEKSAVSGGALGASDDTDV